MDEHFARAHRHGVGGKRARRRPGKHVAREIEASVMAGADEPAPFAVVAQDAAHVGADRGQRDHAPAGMYAPRLTVRFINP